MKEKMLEIRATREKRKEEKGTKKQADAAKRLPAFCHIPKGSDGVLWREERDQNRGPDGNEKTCNRQPSGGEPRGYNQKRKKENYIPARAAPSSSHWETPSPSGAF